MDVLVLSGGGSRGAYQAGALLAFEEAGYRPDLLVGTSIGAVNGTAAVGGMPVQDLVRTWRRLRTRDVFGPRLLLRAPLVAGGLRTLLDDLDWERVRRGTRIRVTAIDLEARRPTVWENDVLDTQRLMASTALPPAFPPVDVDGRRYIDGGIWQNPPVEHALEEPVERMVILCHEPVQPHEEPPARGIRAQAMAISDVVWHSRAVEAITSLEARRALPKRHPFHVPLKELHVVAPRRSLVDDILRFDPEISAAAIAEGHADAHAWLERS